MFYLIGDIHGHFQKLSHLVDKIKKYLTLDDSLVFLGDYIDRGYQSFEVIDYLVSLKDDYNTILLKGNHEDMFLNYLKGYDVSIFMYNGGHATIQSYEETIGSLKLPQAHKNFFNSLKLYYETEDFIAVHAGLRQGTSLQQQSEHDLLWIREEFYQKQYTWDKTVIFGHTATFNITVLPIYEVYDDKKKNIIGIDTGAAYGGPLTCLRMPDRQIFQSY